MPGQNLQKYGEEGKIFYKLERVNYVGSKLIQNIPKFLKPS